MERFTGFIAGLGTAAGRRVVVGHWTASPLGPFTDVMTEDADGVRTLLAPTEAVAGYVSRTYLFDDVVVAPLAARLHRPPGDDALELQVRGGPLDLRAVLGMTTLLGRALERIPPPLAIHPAWLTAVSRLAGVLVPGVATAGSAGGGRREYYGVRSIRPIARATTRWDGHDLGPLAPVDPPVRFGFSSVPRRPQAVAVTTTILPPRH